MLLSR
ncbi:hypothetical protein VCHENC02_2115A, partial [Vibrio harveyi]